MFNSLPILLGAVCAALWAMVREWNYYNIIYGDGGLFEVFLVSKQKEGKANTPQQAGAGLACSFGSKGRVWVGVSWQLILSSEVSVRSIEK